MTLYWSNDPAPEIAYQILGYGGGYIPYVKPNTDSAGGRHIQDDYGMLKQALPQHHYQEYNWHQYHMWAASNSDQHYYGH